MATIVRNLVSICNFLSSIKADPNSIASCLNPGVNYDLKVRQQLRSIYSIQPSGSAVAEGKVLEVASPLPGKICQKCLPCPESRRLPAVPRPAEYPERLDDPPNCPPACGRPARPAAGRN